jgi:hypothetical protein
MDAETREKWAREEIAKVKYEVAFKLGAAVQGGNLERAEILSRILGNLLDKPTE